MAEQYITAIYGLVESCQYGTLRDELLCDRLVIGIANRKECNSRQTWHWKKRRRWPENRRPSTTSAKSCAWEATPRRTPFYWMQSVAWAVYRNSANAAVKSISKETAVQLGEPSVSNATAKDTLEHNAYPKCWRNHTRLIWSRHRISWSNNRDRPVSLEGGHTGCRTPSCIQNGHGS